MKTFLTLFLAASSGSASLRFIQEVAEQHATHATICALICLGCSFLAWIFIEELKFDARFEILGKWIESTKKMADAIAADEAAEKARQEQG